MIYYLLIIVPQQLIRLKIIKKFKNFLIITKDPQKRAKGTEPTMNGISNFKLCLPAFTYVIEFQKQQ